MKKSQIKMGETMAILVIFFFLVMFGFSFYTKIQKVSFEKQQKLMRDLAIIKLTQRASFMTEFQCSFKDISVDNCYDSLKLEAFEDVIENEPGVKDYYFSMFGDTHIRIKEIYPGQTEYLIYDNPLAEWTFKDEVVWPISIYNATTKRFSIGLMNVTMYSK
jgi:hypothetical protein